MADHVTRDTARTADEVTEAVARWCWWEEHDGAECPAHRIPKAAELAEWLPECPAVTRDEAADLLAALYPAGATWERISIGGPATVGGDDPERWLHEGTPHLCAFIRAPEPQPGMLAVPDGRGGWSAVVTADIQDAHRAWSALPDPRPRHPLAPVVDAWQRRAPDLRGATVTATVHDNANGGMIRRPVLLSTVRRVAWRPDPEGPDPLVTGAVVDGQPMAAQRPDTTDLFPVRKRRPRRKFKPGEQAALPLPVVPPIPHDLRLVALADLAGDPLLQGDVLALLAFAWAADRPLVLLEREGAKLLSRHRDGHPRPPVDTDFPRFWEAAAALRALLAFDPGGSGAWVDLATVEVPRIRPVDRVTIGPPAWARGEHVGKWTLTAEASAASIARAVSGEQGMAGRIVTGIEYRLAAGYTGRPGTVAPDLRPADRRRKASAGPLVELDWRTCLRLAGAWWDATNPVADKAALARYRRAVTTLERRGYFVPDSNPRAEAPAGDSVEIFSRRSGGRGRPAGLLVRASARFVEAARLAQLPSGKGFETRLLTDWAGLTPER